MKHFLVVMCLFASAMIALAQAPAPAAKTPAATAPTKDPVATSLRLVLQRFRAVAGGCARFRV